MSELRKRSKTTESGASASSKLAKSPINYFSDLFVVVMVTGWAGVLIVMTACAVYATVRHADTEAWAYVTETVTVPLSAGGAIWMVKNSVQHAIAAAQGRECKEDFPAVDGDESITGREEPLDLDGGGEVDVDIEREDVDETGGEFG